MKLWKTGQWVILILLVCSTTWGGITYYVATDGDDGDPGTESQPFATIQKAIFVAGVSDPQENPSDPNTIIIEEGTYTVTNTITFYRELSDSQVKSKKNNIVLIFDPDTVVQGQAGQGDFIDENNFNPLFHAIMCQGIDFWGYGATCRITGCTTGESRHVLRFAGCSDIGIYGLTLGESGGDGIYLGWVFPDWDDNSSNQVSDPRYNSDIIIRDVVCDNNRRNGMSIQSAKNTTIEGCVFKNTVGTLPKAGIDIEPEIISGDSLWNVNITNCIFENNGREGLVIGLTKWSDFVEEEIRVIVQDCYITGNGEGRGLNVSYAYDDPNYVSDPNEGIWFENVLVENVEYGARLYNKSDKAPPVTFKNCLFKNTASSGRAIDIQGNPIGDRTLDYPGGIEIDNCQVLDYYDRTAIEYSGTVSYLYDVGGDLYAHNPLRTDASNLYNWNSATLSDVDITVYAAILDHPTVHTKTVVNKTWSNWFGSIGEAISDANSLDEIEVFPGVYEEGIDFGGKAITLQGSMETDWEVIDATVIDAQDLGRVVSFDDSEDPCSILAGMTLTNGKAPGTSPDRDGGGIYCNGSNPTIRHCVIAGNLAEDDGGGIYCYNNSDAIILECEIINNTAGDKGGGIYCRTNSDATINGCVVRDNDAEYGGGIHCAYSSHATIEECDIYYNHAITQDGGGVYIRENSSPLVQNCWIYDNKTDDKGGGVYVRDSGSNPTIRNCMIVSNYADYGGGMNCYSEADPNVIGCTFTDNSSDTNGGGIRFESDCDAVIRNSIFWDNTSSSGGEVYIVDDASDPYFTYCDIDGALNGTKFGGYSATGNNNINSDPKFTDASNKDYHIEYDSACIDVGDPSESTGGQTDIDNLQREINSRIDIGADEYDDPVALWKMDEETGGTAYDSTSNDNDGTLQNGPTWQSSEGQLNGAIELDGSDDYISVSDDDSISVGAGDYTLCAWINPDTITGYHGLLVKIHGGNDKEFAFTLLKASDTYLMLDMEKDGNDQYARSENIDFITGQWQHVAVTFNATSKTPVFYYNGQVVETTSNSIDTLPDELDDELNIGRWGSATYNSRYFDGLMDDIRIYNRELTADDISHLASMGPWDLGLDEPVAHWQLDETSGLTAIDRLDGNDGTLVNGATWQSSGGQLYGAIELDGTDDYIAVSDSEEVSVGAGDYTITAWINPDTVTDIHGLVTKLKDGNDKEFVFSLQYYNAYNTWLRLDVEKDGNNGYARTGNINVQTGSWQHVAVVFDSNTKTPIFYFEGEAVTLVSDYIDSLPDQLSDDLSIGRWGGTYNSNYFDGLIDDVRIYNFPLTPAEIRSLANMGP
ncbi:MAG: right-handed parallel beta-helix repeat-containing protein [Sedimentisphaerales bacterium]|nr:right-handed parallel beta-helix repeat-containing protein [Sedimentisphaerales bacterium]